MKTPPICIVHVTNSILNKFPTTTNNLNLRSKFNFQFWIEVESRKKKRMLCLGIIGGVTTKCLQFYDSRYRTNNKKFINLNNKTSFNFNTRWRFMALESDSSFASSTDSDTTAATGYTLILLSTFYFLLSTSPLLWNTPHFLTLCRLIQLPTCSFLEVILFFFI